MKIHTSVDMEHVRETKTILLGPEIAHFSLGSKSDRVDMKGNVVGSGKTLRVTLFGYPGYVDIDITQAVNQAIKLLKG